VKIKRKSPTPRESFQSLARQSKGSKRLILSTSGNSERLDEAVENQNRANAAFERLTKREKYEFIQIDRIRVPLIWATGIFAGAAYVFFPRRVRLSDMLFPSAYAADTGYIRSERSVHYYSFL
jgi:hypothetical protein